MILLVSNAYNVGIDTFWERYLCRKTWYSSRSFILFHSYEYMSGFEKFKKEYPRKEQIYSSLMCKKYSDKTDKIK